MLKIDNPELFRQNIRKQLDKILNANSDISDIDKFSTDLATNLVTNLAINLEKGIFNFSLKEAERRQVLKKWDNFYFLQIYLAHLKSVMTNLNESLINNLKKNNIEPQQIAFMTHQEWSPDKWEKLISAKSKRDQQKFVNNMEASTDTFTCRKCKGNKCVHFAMQTRSADEPMTIYVTCLDCGQRWKTS
jgi:DNA-directed RNA polymerase subunit M/transcription elongation factor TFIIS